MPFPVNGLEQHYAIAPESYFQAHDTSAKERGADWILDPAERLLGGKGKLLDIGAGRGELLCAAGRQGWVVAGIETSSTFAESAVKLSGAEIRREPIEQCEFPDSSFDVVVMAAVLEHLYQPAETIREIARILRPGGVLYLEVPNEAGPYFRLGNLYQKLRRRDWVVNLSPTFSPFHVFGFTCKSLRALLAKHGLKPAVWRVYAGDYNPPDVGGLCGIAERLAARAITRVSELSGWGNQIETWAVKI
jgi:SAM-dependent methyltransferase